MIWGREITTSAAIGVGEGCPQLVRRRRDARNVLGRCPRRARTGRGRWRGRRVARARWAQPGQLIGVPQLGFKREEWVQQVEALAREQTLDSWVWKSRYERRKDIVQETYKRLLQVTDVELAGIDSLRAYAGGIIAHVAYDFRHRGPERWTTYNSDWIEKQSDVDLGTEVDLVSRVEAAQILSILEPTIEQLPERRHLVLALRVIKGYATKEVAARLKIKESTVKKHLLLCVQQLAAVLENAGIGSSRNRKE